MKLIYQVGRLDGNIEQSYSFAVHDKVYNQPLSSLALKEHFGPGQSKVVLVYPVSLPFNKNVPSGYRLEGEEARTEYLSDPHPFFESHPHTRQADGFVVVHSIGTYWGQRFEGSYDAIVLRLFVDMVQRFLLERIKEIYIDISSGQNIFVAALLEAIRYFMVFCGLQSWHLQNGITRAYVCFSEPVFQPDEVYQIYSDREVRHKAFFEAPLLIKEEGCRNQFVKALVGDQSRELKKKTQELYRQFLVCYSAMANGTPMVFYSFPDLVTSQQEVKNLIEDLASRLQTELAKDWAYAPKVIQQANAMKNWRDLIFCFALYLGIIELLEHRNVRVPSESGVDLERMENDFSFIYDRLSVPGNVPFLKSEVSNTKKKALCKARGGADWRLLGEGSRPNFDPRNFTAHIGLQETFTEFRVDGNNVFVRYAQIENLRTEVENLLLKAL